MNRLYIIIGLSLSLLFPALLQGQETGLLRMDKKQWNPESTASVWGGVEDGRFKPVHAAKLQWSAGAEAHFLRPGNKSTWTATASFEQTAGKHWGSSLFLDPELYPMDLLDLTTGWKSRQTGRVEFGFLRDLSDIWAAGLKASVKAANEAKLSAPRHSSIGMEVQLEPTLTFVSDDDACFIASYLVRLRTERVKAEAGDTPVYLDKGMGYGLDEPGLGVFPLKEYAHGFFGQYRSPEYSGGFGITWKRGHAGEKDYSRFRFPGSTLKGFFETTVEGFEIDQVYRVSYQRDRDQLRELHQYGYYPCSDRNTRNLSFRFGLRPHEGALKNVAIDLDGNQWIERAFSAYDERVEQFGGTATLLATLALGQFDLDASLSGGGGWWKERGLTDEPMDPLLRLPDFWLKQMDYRLLPRIGMEATATWHAPFKEGLSFQLYAGGLRSFKLAHLGGKNREFATLKVLYNY